MDRKFKSFTMIKRNINQNKVPLNTYLWAVKNYAILFTQVWTILYEAKNSITLANYHQ